jgi:serine protease Do
MRSHISSAATLLAAIVVLAAPITGFAKESADSAPRRTWLGVVTQRIDDDLREGLSLKGDGVLVNSVASESPASRAGIKQGDVIASINGKSVDSPDALQELVRAAKAGDRAQLDIVRDGKHQNITATLGERPNSMSWGDDRHRIMIREAPEAQMDFGGVPQVADLALFGRGRLGVQLDDLNPDLGEYFSVPGGKGALVTSVVKESAASRAGLKAGDVIVKVGDHDVESSDDVARTIRSLEGRVAIGVVRKGSRLTLNAELEARRTPHAMNMEDMDLGDLPVKVQIMEHRQHEISQLHRDMQELRDELRELREQLKQKSQN